ncbi:MAG: hypothetical protein ACR2HC_04240 [Thermoleophilaceae bacterium]
MDGERDNSLGPPNGLCDSCAHQKLIHNTRGSTFSMCGRAKSDERFAKYPRVPVHRCPGWRALEGAAGL